MKLWQRRGEATTCLFVLQWKEVRGVGTEVDAWRSRGFAREKTRRPSHEHWRTTIGSTQVSKGFEGHIYPRHGEQPIREQLIHGCADRRCQDFKFQIDSSSHENTLELFLSTNLPIALLRQPTVSASCSNEIADKEYSIVDCFGQSPCLYWNRPPEFRLSTVEICQTI